MKIIISFLLLLTTYYLHADVPGNKPRIGYNIKITGLKEYKDYSFYFQNNNDVSQLKDSSNFYVEGGYGAPKCIEVWAMNNKNSINTDTLYFCSGDEKKSQTIKVNICKNHLSFSASTTKRKKENSIPFSSTNNNQNDNNQFSRNTNIMYFISFLSLLALITLMFFVWKKNKQTKLQKSI